MLVDPKVEVQTYEVIKFLIGFPERLLCLSVLCGIDTHFLGSSKICGGSACPACKSGIASKFVGYVAVLFKARRRLLRLTAASARYGLESGVWQPGQVIEVEKFQERRPLRVVGVNSRAVYERAATVSSVELLSVVARLHGLPGLDLAWTIDDCKKIVEKNAVTSVGLALKGLSA